MEKYEIVKWLENFKKTSKRYFRSNKSRTIKKRNRR